MMPGMHRQRVLIQSVRPGGDYAVKRVSGEPLVVEADVVCDGHDVVRALLLYRHAGATAWEEVELAPVGNDVYTATLAFEKLGRFHYGVVAWVDAFATWRRGLERKVAASQDVALELLEGAQLVAAAVARGAPLVEAERILRDPSQNRVAFALGAQLAEAMARYPDREHATTFAEDREVLVERPLARASAWYELFPRSAGAPGTHGTLRDVIARLDYVAELGFDILYLPPIHPIGVPFRKGPDNTPDARPGDPGSPWAIANHLALHPELGTLADFDALVAACAARKLELALDIAFQCAPDHPWVREHPAWFKQRPDGSIQYAENPPKKYQDVYPFDFESADAPALWAALRDVFVFWAERGVRVFRVDNPHTKPIPFWRWCLAEVSARYPDAIFLAEAFTRPKVKYALARAGFSQGYTYFTWRTGKRELEAYLRELVAPPVADFFRPNFWPTTPDIFPEHLVHGGRAAFVQRLVLAATLGGSYGIYGPSYELMEAVQRTGVEELARSEKYELRAWEWDRADSLRHVMARVNRIRRAHPAFAEPRTLRFHPTDNEYVIAYSRRAGNDVVVVTVNLDPHHTHRAWIELDVDALGVGADESYQVHDLLGDARYQWRGGRAFVELVPSTLPAHIFELRRFMRSENQFEYFL
jgi:starch synthase (maltosyl-transferring)